MLINIERMKKIVILLIAIIPICSKAQTSTGINFENIQNWNSVLEKARVEHKFIFVDAYASWCVPCKQMDKETYSDSTVGTLAKKYFISIRIQMDSTNNDNTFVKNWHKESSIFQKKIQAYPTLLFFTAEGELIGKEIGYQSAEKFSSILLKLTDEKDGYISRVKAFNQGSLGEQQLFELSQQAKNIGNDSLAKRIAIVYKKKFIDQKAPEEVLKPSLLGFLSDFSFLFNLEDRLTKYIYTHKEKADQLTDHKDFASNYINYIVRRDFFKKIRTNDGKIISSHPNWDQIESDISKKLDAKTAKATVLAEKINYFSGKKNWDKQAEYEFDQVAFKGIDINDDINLATINDMIFSAIFDHDVSEKYSQKGIHYMEILLKARPNNFHFIDTYSNLLYKTGQKDKAIKLSELALDLAIKDKYWDVKSYQETLTAMKNGKPTWSYAVNAN